MIKMSSQNRTENKIAFLLYNKHCKPTFIRGDFISRFTSDKLVRYNLFSRPSSIETRVVITTIRKGLVCGVKYSRRRSLDTRKFCSKYLLGSLKEQ